MGSAPLVPAADSAPSGNGIMPGDGPVPLRHIGTDHKNKTQRIEGDLRALTAFTRRERGLALCFTLVTTISSQLRLGGVQIREMTHPTTSGMPL